MELKTLEKLTNKSIKNGWGVFGFKDKAGFKYELVLDFIQIRWRGKRQEHCLQNYSLTDILFGDDLGFARAFFKKDYLLHLTKMLPLNDNGRIKYMEDFVKENK